METFSVPWRLRWWDDDGTRHDEDAVELLEALDEWHARDNIRRRTIARVESPKRPFRLAFDDDRVDLTLNSATYPASIPDRHVLRGKIIAGTSPSTLFAELLDARATRLEILIAFARAFGVRHEEAIVDLDAITREQHEWSKAYFIRDAFEHGRSVVDALHVLHNNGHRGAWPGLGRAFRDALDVEFGDVNTLVELASNRDPTFDRELAVSMERVRIRNAAPDRAGL